MHVITMTIMSLWGPAIFTHIIIIASSSTVCSLLPTLVLLYPLILSSHSLSLYYSSLCRMSFSRLAVSFRSDDGSPSDAALVAVFNTHMRYSSAHPDLTFGGFVRGPSSTQPAIIAFEAGCSAAVSCGTFVCTQIRLFAFQFYNVCRDSQQVAWGRVSYLVCVSALFFLFDFY